MNSDEQNLPPRLRAEIEVKKHLLDVCRLKSRHRDPLIAFAYSREALLIKNEIDALCEKSVAVLTDKPEAALAGRR